MKARNMIAIAAVLGSVVGFANAGTVHDVIVAPGGAFVFSPNEIVIEVGDTVRWTWDSGGHNVGSGLPGEPTDAFLSGPPADAGTVFEVVFDQEFLDANPIKGNLYDYHCHPHGSFGMIGSVQVLAAPSCPWDLDGNGSVGAADLLALLIAWGPNPGHPADFNGDGSVGSADLLALLINWGPCL